ncbi:MAG: four helix bundle protein [Candidatus Omnitrophica bacterium]|nr:four helix bundle protein [Candidatus Omnitrophota bacterium]
MSSIKSYEDLLVYQKAYTISLEINTLVRRNYPIEEKYLLSDQTIRASRSIPSNIAEGWSKRKYKNVFIKHLVDADGSCNEIKVWLDYAKDLKYIDNDQWEKHVKSYIEIGKMLNGVISKWK